MLPQHFVMFVVLFSAGEATVQQLYKVQVGRQKNVPVAGCRCTMGALKKKQLFKLVRDDKTLVVGKTKRFFCFILSDARVVLMLCTFVSWTPTLAPLQDSYSNKYASSA